MFRPLRTKKVSRLSKPQPTSIYTTDEDREIIAEQRERTGLSRSALYRYAIHRVFRGREEEPGKQARLLEIAEELRQLAE
jgi:hypothetical protein